MIGIVDSPDHLNGWTEDDINAHSIALTAAVCAVWPGPSTEVQQAAFEASAGQPAGELNEVPWTGADITRLADEAGETLLIVLDTLASDPSRKWQNSDFVDAQLTDRAYAALGALTNKVRGSFGRSNVPVQYNKVGTTWSWYLNEVPPKPRRHRL